MITPNLPSAAKAQTKSSDTKAASSMVHPLLGGNEASKQSSFQDHLAQAAQAQSSKPVKKAARPEAPTPQPSKGLEKNLEPRNRNAASPAKDSSAQKTSKTPNPGPEARTASKTPARTDSKPSLESKSAAPSKAAPEAKQKTGEELDADELKVPSKDESQAKSVKLRGPVQQKPTSESGDPAENAVLVAAAQELAGQKAEELSPEEQSKRLEALMALLGSQMPLNELPSIAMLSGRLEQIEPAAIPETITGNPLIQNFVASEDPAKLVDQVKPLGSWLKDMGWSPEGMKIENPEGFQQLMETPISLRDLMQDFGVDVGRVIQEARMLQATLPLDGVAPYMERAQRLQGSKGPAEGGKEKQAMPFVMAAMGHALAQQDAAISKTAAPVQDIPVQMPLENAIPADNLWVSTADLPADTMIPLSLAAELPKATPQPKLAAEQVAVPMMTNQGPVLVIPNTVNPMMAQQDPITVMMQQNPGLMQNFTFAPKAAEAVARPELQAQAPASMDLLQSLQAIQIQQEPKDMPGAQRAEGLDKLLAFASPEAVMAIREGDSEKPREDGLGEKKGQGEDQQGLTQTQNQKQGGAVFSLDGKAEVQKAQLPPQVMKEVFDNSSMLLKEGGGTMTIEIGNKELGTLNLSVEVKDKEVEVKILAPNAQARELIATELPKLREALQNQNLDLKRVDVGLGGGNSYSQTSSDGRNSSRREEFQSFEDSGTRGVGGASRSSRGYRSVSVSSSNNDNAPRVNHDGAISVRV